MSGFTTTGATIFIDFERVGRAVMFWRSLTQWLGGMGMITLFVATLPRLAMGVGRLFFAEAPGSTDDKLTLQIRKTAGAGWQLYARLTLIRGSRRRWGMLVPGWSGRPHGQPRPFAPVEQARLDRRHLGRTT